jgi:hypothetical protein
MADAVRKEVPTVESSMPGVQAAVITPALASAAVVGACTPHGMAAVLLPGTGAPLTTRLRAIADASEPRPRGTHVFLQRQDTPQQHNLQKFAYSNGTAAANGDVSGLPQPWWDPV